MLNKIQLDVSKTGDLSDVVSYINKENINKEKNCSLRDSNFNVNTLISVVV